MGDISFGEPPFTIPPSVVLTSIALSISITRMNGDRVRGSPALNPSSY